MFVSALGDNDGNRDLWLYFSLHVRIKAWNKRVYPPGPTAHGLTLRRSMISIHMFCKKLSSRFFFSLLEYIVRVHESSSQQLVLPNLAIRRPVRLPGRRMLARVSTFRFYLATTCSVLKHIFIRMGPPKFRYATTEASYTFIDVPTSSVEEGRHHCV